MNKIYKKIGLTAKQLIKKGRVLRDLNKYSESLQAFNRALEREPNNHSAWCKKTAVLIYLEKYQEAVEASDRAMETNPDCNVA